MQIQTQSSIRNMKKRGPAAHAYSLAYACIWTLMLPVYHSIITQPYDMADQETGM